MSEYEKYFQYLRKRSLLGLLYRRLWLYKELSKHLHGEVLDVGCGIGDMLHFRPKTIGVDINPITVNWLRLQGMNVHLMRPDQLPFGSGSFDSVLVDNVLEHIVEPMPLLLEIKRVLRTSGNLLIGVPGERGFLFDQDHQIFYNEEALISCVSRAGYRASRIFYTPFKSEWANKNIRQYCMYGVFEKEKI